MTPEPELTDQDRDRDHRDHRDHRERDRDIVIDRDGLSAQQLMTAVEELENGDIGMGELEGGLGVGGMDDLEISECCCWGVVGMGKLDQRPGNG